MIKKLIQNKYSVLFLFILIAIASDYRTLGLYFWHDDYSVMHDVVNGVCNMPWVSISFCPIFSFLYSIFGYRPFPYFFLGFLLEIFSLISFYLFVKELISKKAALCLTLIFSSGYIGAGVFLMMTESITTYLSLGLLFLSLFFLIKSTKSKKQTYYLLLGFIFYLLTTYLVHFRASTYFVLLLGLIWIFLNKKLRVRTAIILSALVILVFITKYFLEPYLTTGNALAAIGRSGVRSISLQIIKDKSVNYLSSVGNYLPIDFTERSSHIRLSSTSKTVISVVLGIFIHIACIFTIFLNRKKPIVVGLIIFSLIWLTSQYLPQGLVTDSGLESSNRYTLFPYVGFLLLLGGIFYKKEKGLLIFAVIFSLINIIQSNYFFSQLEPINIGRKNFYTQLKKYVKDVPHGTVFYFDAPRGTISNEMSDYFRVGLYSPEASIATELGVKMENIRMYTNSTILTQKIMAREINPDKFFTFFWDGHTLSNTTAKARGILKGGFSLKQEMNVFQKTDLIYDNKLGQWTGNNPEIGFEINNFQPLVPSIYYVSIKASPFSPPLPYTQGCSGCSFSQDYYKKTIDYLIYSRLIKNEVSVATSNDWDGTKAENLIDGDLSIYWLANRLDWFTGKKPVISLVFLKRTSLDGFVLYSQPSKNTPAELKIFADGKAVESLVFDNNKGKIKVLASIKNVKVLTLEIQKTFGDTPLVAEIDPIPEGYANVNLSFAEELTNFPAEIIKREDEKKAMFDYLASGVRACLKRENPAYGEGQTDFTLYVDGKWHIYRILFPIWGLDNPKLSISCLNYPVELTLSSVTVNYLQAK